MRNQIQVSLNDTYAAKLHALTEQTGLSRSDLIRRWIDEHYERTRPVITEATLEPCTLDEISAADLRAEIASIAPEVGAETLKTYRVRSPQTGEVGWMLHVPSYGRAGIAWGADALWTDCEDEEDALRRYLADEMVN